MGQIVCFGELLLRMTAPGRELLLQRPHFDVHVGGAEANVAVGMAHLGHDVHMVSAVPDTALGDAAVRHLRGHGVDASAVARMPGRMGLYFLSPGAGLRASQIIYDRAASSFALMDPASLDWNRLLDGAELLHLSGITPALGPGLEQASLDAARAARRLGVRLSFDVNYRPSLWEGRDARPTLSALIGEADILFANHRDAALLLDRRFDGDGPTRRREAAEAMLDAFARVQFIASTARHVDDADRHLISARIDTREGQVQTDEILVAGIVDRIGAGDAFAAGILHGIVSAQDLGSAVRAGLALACLKHTVPGDASLFATSDIDAFWQGNLDVRR